MVNIFNTLSSNTQHTFGAFNVLDTDTKYDECFILRATNRALVQESKFSVWFLLILSLHCAAPLDVNLIITYYNILSKPCCIYYKPW